MTEKKFPCAFWFFTTSCLIVFFLLLFGSMRDVVLRFVPDDAFYYFRIATNWYRYGFSTFDSINPTNGYHPLWQWILIFPSSFFADIEIFTRIGSAFGAIFIFCAGILMYRTARQMHFQTSNIIWYWLTGSLVFASIYGMESPLAVLILASLIFSLPYDLTQITFKRVLICGLLSGFLFLTRLDILIWIGTLDFVIAVLAIIFRKEALKVWIHGFMFFLIQGAAILGYFVYNILTFNHLFSVSSLVKAGRADFFSFHIGLSLLFLLGLGMTLLSGIILIDTLTQYFRRHKMKFSYKIALVLWLSLANIIYIMLIAAKGGIETYNWYFVNIILSGAILLPFCIENLQIPHLHLSYRLKFRALAMFSLLVLGITVYGKVTQSSDFVGAYDRAEDLSKFSEGSIIFASGDCGILGTLSLQHCLNMDGLTNSFAFQEALRDDRLAEWLKNAGVNGFFTSKDEKILSTGTLHALPGIYDIGRTIQVKLIPWPDINTEKLEHIRLYRIEKNEN